MSSSLKKSHLDLFSALDNDRVSEVSPNVDDSNSRNNLDPPTFTPSSSPQPSPKFHPKFPEKPQSSPTNIPSVPRDISVDKNLDLETSSHHSNEVGPGHILQTSDNISRSSESSKSLDLQRSPDTGSIRDLSKEKKSSDKKKKTSSWYNVLNPTYKSRSEDFKRLFKDLPESERLIVDYSCALQKDILVHGRLYVSQNYLCFYANIFRWETVLVIRCKDITAMTKEKTARVIPNAIQICTESEKHFFTSFGARDKTYLMLFRVWQNALMEQPMSIQELWQVVHTIYGDELGLTSDDDDYVAPTAEDDAKNNNDLLQLQDPKELKMSKSSYESASDPSPKSSLGPTIKESPASSESPQASEVSVKDAYSAVPSILPVSKPLNKAVLPDSQVPTDLSDTTESDSEPPRNEFLCSCCSHSGKEIINTVYNIPVDHIFTLLFSESRFYCEFLKSRKTTDLVQSQWQINPDTEHKLRQVTYTLTLNLSVGPKTAQTTETQTMLKGSKPGSMYVIDVEAVTTGIPYSDTFYTYQRYCITRISPSECRLRVHSQIKYKKSVWGLVKTFIEKNAMQGVEDYLKDLEIALHQEVEKSQQNKKIRRRRRLIKPDIGKVETVTDGLTASLKRGSSNRRMSPSFAQTEITRTSGTDLLVKIIFIVLVVLLFLNALLYYKLWSLETQANKFILPPSLLDLEVLRKNPRTNEEWVHIVQQQQVLHQAELEKWTDILESAVKLLQKTEDSLSLLQRNIKPTHAHHIIQMLIKDEVSKHDGSEDTSESVINKNNGKA